MDRLLAILDRPELAPAVLAAAALLRPRLPGSRLELLHPRPERDPGFLPTEEMWTTERAARFEAEQDAVLAALREAIAAWPGPGAAPALRVEAGAEDAVVAHAASAGDLLLLGAPTSRHDLEGRAALHAALFHDAPVLLVPPRPPVALGVRVALAWEPSRAAEEALAAALPLLRGARMVLVLTAQEGRDAPAPPAGLLETLRRHGVDTETRRLDPGGRDVAAALLEAAHGAGADLMVMGAFTHNRVLEVLFGGTTREVLAEADLSLLLHH